MSGIYGRISLDNKERDNFSEFFSNKNYTNRIKSDRAFTRGPYRLSYGRSVLDKFLNDRSVLDSADFIIMVEGIVYNYHDSGYSNSVEYVKSLYEKHKSQFVNYIDGLFSGFIFDKKANRIVVFNDHLASRSIFYFFSKESKTFIFSSEFFVTARILQTSKFKLNIDRNGFYSLLLYGYLLGDDTLLCDVKRLQYGSILSLDIEQFDLKRTSYYSLPQDQNTSIKSNEAIESIDEMFTNSVNREWGKDTSEHYNHLSFLSGGMDAKTNVLVAKSLGYKQISTATIGQSDSLDIKIANEIASKNHFNHTFHQLDGGSYLIQNIENYIDQHGGLVFYSGNAHIINTIQTLNLTNFGLLHSGQIGDVLFGSFTGNFSLEKRKTGIGYTGKVVHEHMLNKIESLGKHLSKYQSVQNGMELFSYEQRQMNATLMGDRSLNNFIDHVSPFYNKELIEYCISLPNKFKANQRLYFDWLKAKHPEVLSFKWEKINARPTSHFKIRTLKKLRWLYNGSRKKLGLKYDSMNPFARWYVQNHEIETTLDRIFSSNTHLIEDTELRNDLIAVYSQSNDPEKRNKFTVISLLLSIKTLLN